MKEIVFLMVYIVNSILTDSDIRKKNIIGSQDFPKELCQQREICATIDVKLKYDYRIETVIVYPLLNRCNVITLQCCIYIHLVCVESE
jgi:hypothetical protein